jgi:hypothetical protein
MNDKCPNNSLYNSIWAVSLYQAKLQGVKVGTAPSALISW